MCYPPPSCIFSPHVNGEERGRRERRYATLPQTPPQSDWKVMGLKETFSQHSPQLCDLRARHSRARTHGPIKHLINYTAWMYISEESKLNCNTLNLKLSYSASAA